MRIVFCDDDTAVMDKLEKYLRAYFNENKLKQPEYEAFTNGEELLKSDSRPDIAFLDVEMPGIDGITVGARLKKKFPYVKIIILTSFSDYLDEAMKFHVFRYLSKPLERSRLYRNMKDALYQISVDTKPVLIETASESITRFADEVIMVEANKHKVKVYTVDKVYESIQPMKHWETFLDVGSFYNVHRSYIVNMKFVRSFDSATIKMGSPSGENYRAYMARRKYSGFKSAYIRYLEAMK